MPDTKPILFIVDGAIDVTGALVSAQRQSALLADKVKTILILPRGHKVSRARTTAFAEVIELPIVSLRKSLASMIAYLPALIAASFMLRREMSRRGCERLQLNDFHLAHGAMLRLLGFRGRIVTFVRIDPTRFGVAGRIWLAAARWGSTEMVAVSRFIQGLLGPHYPSRLVYEQVATAPRPSDRPNNAPILLFVGNYIEGKGQEHAVDAFHRIAAQFPKARLRFIGSDMGSDRNRLFREKLERSAKDGPAPDRIEFRGSTNNLSRDYAEAYAVLNFSASESFSMTCLDASAAGLPVVATRCGGPEEIVEDGVTGFLVPVGDVDAMAQRMARLLDQTQEAVIMGAAGRALVQQRFPPAYAAAKFNALFNL